MCRATEAVQNQPISDDYGVEYGHGRTQNPFDAGNIVEIPLKHFHLTALQMDYIQRYHDSLLPSDYQGVDLYLALVDAVSAMVT